MKTSALVLSLSLFCFSWFSVCAELPQPKKGYEWEDFGHLAIQSRGRIKPFDTYARESAQFITGKTSWNGFSYTELVVSWLTAYDSQWVETPFIRVDYAPLKKAVGLEAERNYFSPSELRALPELGKLVQSAAQNQKEMLKVEENEKRAQQVASQLGLLEAIARGEDITLLPNPKEREEAWLPISSLLGHADQLPYSPEERTQVAEGLRKVFDSYINNHPEAWTASVRDFASAVRKAGKASYPSESEINREYHYNHLRPFRWAWVMYTLAFISLLTFIISRQPIPRWVGIASITAGFGLHIYGFVIRCLIAGRPPVTNMYESVIWVTFGCVAFALLIWATYKNAVIPTAACAFAIAGLVLADNLPSALDPGIHPLEPVLRSNYWLTIHVLTITLSYAAFALSLCLGNVVLGNFLFRPNETDRIQQLTVFMYRAVQIGVVLIAAGTILGGIWADESWGRFWGWDPKEVWALIALLLYLAVLHGRFTGWIKGFGFATATVFCFLGVLMAWYGVNFVLGAGLHSYGFGSGGLEWVMLYVLIQVGFVIVAYVRYRKNGKADGIFPGRGMSPPR